MGSNGAFPRSAPSGAPDGKGGVDRRTANGPKPPDRRDPPAARPWMLRIDVIAGSLLILIGLASWIDAAPLDNGTLKYFGPGLMPKLLSTVLLAVGLLVLVAGAVGKSAPAAHLRGSIRGSAMIGLALVAFTAAIAGVNIGGVAIPPLGLVVAGPLAVMIAGYASPEARFRELCALAFGFTAGCTAVFNDLLGLSIPVLPDALQAPLSDWVGWETAPRVAYGLYAAITALILVAFPGSGAAPDRLDGTRSE